MKKLMGIVLPAVLAFAFIGGPVAGQDMEQERTPILLVEDKLVWTEGPASMPPGTQMAVLEGDLKKSGPVTVRFRIPANAVIAPHTHPGVERITVLSGTLHFSTGETADTSGAVAFGPGSFIVMPEEHPMFAFTTGEETVLQLNVEGPWGIKFLDGAG